MDLKKILFYTLVFLLGFITGKVIKINVSNRGGCAVARKKLEELRKQMQSETSESYL